MVNWIFRVIIYSLPLIRSNEKQWDAPSENQWDGPSVSHSTFCPFTTGCDKNI